MREIKFRGKHFYNKEWVCGWYFFDDTGEFDAHYIKDSKTLLDEEVDPKSVGQFTGLHDKNGKEIYEGDLLGGAWLTSPVRVKWHDFGHWVVEGTKGCWDEHLCAYKDIEVIGNIHDHPQLLES